MTVLEEHQAEEFSIDIEDFAFVDGEITIQVGDTVTWTNNDSTTHTVTQQQGDFNSGDLLSDGTYSVTFTEAGEYEYYCFYHEGMRGTITVTE